MRLRDFLRIVPFALIATLAIAGVCYAVDGDDQSLTKQYSLGETPQPPKPKVIKKTVTKVVIQCAQGATWNESVKKCIADEVTVPPSRKDIHEGQRWTGYYVCAQGKTKLNLFIESASPVNHTHYSNVKAIFDFDYNNGECVGKFNLTGKYDKNSRILRLKAGSWINNSCNYSKVGMDGVVSADGQTYNGNITELNCNEFSLKLTN